MQFVVRGKHTASLLQTHALNAVRAYCEDITKHMRLIARTLRNTCGLLRGHHETRAAYCEDITKHMRLIARTSRNTCGLLRGYHETHAAYCEDITKHSNTVWSELRLLNVEVVEVGGT
jgi:tetrahydromethanopterin S-methyltransferase subunit F